MDTKVLEATPADAAQLSEIALAAKKYCQYPDSWYDKWGDMFIVSPEFIKSNIVRVAMIGNDIVGFIAISTDDFVAELEHMWVLPKYMNQGIGSSLFSVVVDYCKYNGIRKLRIESDPNAKIFYEKMGAKHIGYVESLPRPRELPVLELTINV